MTHASRQLGAAALAAFLATVSPLAAAAQSQPGPSYPAAASQPDAATPATPAAPAAAKPAEAPSTSGGLIGPPPAGKGQVVFYRPSRIGGMAVSFTVKENGNDVVKLGNGSYYMLVADPGPHRFQMESEATDTTNIEVEAGETQYLEETIGVGIVMAHPHLIPSNQAKFDGFRPGSMKLAKAKGAPAQ